MQKKWIPAIAVYATGDQIRLAEQKAQDDYSLY